MQHFPVLQKGTFLIRINEIVVTTKLPSLRFSCFSVIATRVFQSFNVFQKKLAVSLTCQFLVSHTPLASHNETLLDFLILSGFQKLQKQQKLLWPH